MVFDKVIQCFNKLNLSASRHNGKQATRPSNLALNSITLMLPCLRWYISTLIRALKFLGMKLWSNIFLNRFHLFIGPLHVLSLSMFNVSNLTYPSLVLKTDNDNFYPLFLIVIFLIYLLLGGERLDHEHPLVPIFSGLPSFLGTV